MKKIILSILFAIICIASFGQSTFIREGSTSGTNTYTATVTSFTSYTSAALILKFNNGNTSTATINVNSIGAVNIRKWDGDSWESLASGDIPANSDVLLVHDNTNSYFKAYVLPEIGQGSTYTAGSGLTLTADQFKLGGTITENTTFSNSGFNVTHASSGARMAAYRIWATTIGLDGSTSAFIQSGDNTVTTSAASGVDIVGDSVRLATDGSQIRLNADGSLSIDGDVGNSGQVITSNGAGPITWEDASGSVGAQDLFISSVAMWPRVTSGSSSLSQTEVSTSLFNVQSLDFDQTTQEFAQMQFVMPRNWNNGTITATIYWTAASGSGGVVWGVSGGAYSNDDALSAALGTAQTVSDTFIAADDLHITSTTSAITLAGTPSDGDFIAIQISRNTADGSDTLNADAKLLGIRITFTLDAGTSE
jgi:hypothetical protein